MTFRSEIWMQVCGEKKPAQSLRLLVGEMGDLCSDTLVFLTDTVCWRWIIKCINWVWTWTSSIYNPKCCRNWRVLGTVCFFFLTRGTVCRWITYFPHIVCWKIDYSQQKANDENQLSSFMSSQNLKVCSLCWNNRGLGLTATNGCEAEVII